MKLILIKHEIRFYEIDMQITKGVEQTNISSFGEKETRFRVAFPSLTNGNTEGR